MNKIKKNSSKNDLHKFISGEIQKAMCGSEHPSPTYDGSSTDQVLSGPNRHLEINDQVQLRAKGQSQHIFMYFLEV